MMSLGHLLLQTIINMLLYLFSVVQDQLNKIAHEHVLHTWLLYKFITYIYIHWFILQWVSNTIYIHVTKLPIYLY